MNIKFLLALIFSFNLGLLMNPSFTFAILYDNFQKSSIDPNKWNSYEFRKQIQNGKFISRTVAHGKSVHNGTFFKDPRNIHHLEAEVTINECDGTYDPKEADYGGSHPYAGIAGYFYNDGSANVHAEVSIGPWEGNLQARWEIWKNFEMVATGVLCDVVTLGTPYKISIHLDSLDKTLTFKVAGSCFSSATWTIPDPINPVTYGDKYIRTHVVNSDPKYSGKISASFDNVVAKDASGITVAQDDFSSSDLNRNVWNDYEGLREIWDGKLLLETKDISFNAGNRLYFKYPEQIRDMQANVTLLAFSNPDGANARARLGGIFFHDPGDLNSQRPSGDIWAEVSLGGNGTTPSANWLVVRGSTTLDSGSFPMPVELGKAYSLFLGWDGTTFTFKCDQYSHRHTPDAPIKRSPATQDKQVSERIQPPESGGSYKAFVSATFDDVMTNQNALPIDGTWLLDISGRNKGGTVIECLPGNTVEGFTLIYGIGLFGIDGSYTTDTKGNVHGSYVLRDYFTGLPLQFKGALTGKIDTKLAKLSLRMADETGLNVSLSGIRLPGDPRLPQSWAVKITGKTKGLLDPFTILPYEEDDQVIPRIFTLSATGMTQETNPVPISMTGLFFLTQKNFAYGWYEMLGSIQGTGSFTGRILLPSGKLNLTAISEKGERFTLSGQVKP